jgi:hypothetical protein
VVEVVVAEEKVDGVVEGVRSGGGQVDQFGEKPYVGVYAEARGG